MKKKELPEKKIIRDYKSGCVLTMLARYYGVSIGVIRRIVHPKEYAARKKTKCAIRTGALKKQPCEVCGNIQAECHHPDYSKPLDVIWLCRKHHMETHGKSMREAPAFVNEQAQ